MFFTLGEVLKFQRPSKLLDSLERESRGKRMASEAEKAQYFTLGEVLKFQSPSKLFDSLEGESLRKRMASGLKSTIFLP
jgi:hypothetical protein